VNIMLGVEMSGGSEKGIAIADDLLKMCCEGLLKI
jgi:hypothetical protein